MLTQEITLEYPVDGPAGRVEKISLRRPKVRDQLKAQEDNPNPALYEVRLLAFVAGQPPEVIEALDFDDYEAVQKAFKGFRKAPVAKATGA